MLPNPQPGSTADFPDRVDRVTTALAHLPLPLPTPTELSQGAGPLRWTHRRYEITIPKPDEPAQIARLLDPLRTAAPGVTLDVNPEPDGAKVQIGIDGLLTHSLTLHWLGHRPRAAIIVDNLGSDLLIARVLTEIDAPLTFAVRPLQPFSREVAELANLFGREVLLQLPADANPADSGGLASTPAGKGRDEVLRRFAQNLATVPHAVGISGRFEASFTDDLDRMEWVLNASKEKKLFVIDNAGTSPGKACEMAAALTLGCAETHNASDDAGDEQAVRKQLDEILHAARTGGEAIAVIPATELAATALHSAIPDFAAAGVDLVPASTLVADRSLSPR